MTKPIDLYSNQITVPMENVLTSKLSIRYFLIFIFTLLCTVVNAQYHKDLISPQNLNSSRTKTPTFSSKQKMWFQKKGVHVVDYKWDDPEINLNLKKAIVSRNFSRVTLGAAGFYFMRGTLLNMVAAMVDKGREKPNGTNSYLVAGGFTILSGITFGIGKGKLNKAKQLRSKQMLAR